LNEMDKSQTPPGRDGGHQFGPGPKVSKKVTKAVNKDPAKHLSDLFAKEYDKKKQGVAEAAFKDPSPMMKDSIKQDRIRSLKNLIAVAKVKGVHHKVKEYELELKKLKETTEVTEAGAFSYGAKPPRKGSVAYNALMKRKEQDKNRVKEIEAIGTKNHHVGVAKVTKAVAEGYTGRETKDGTWRVFKDGQAVAVAGPFKSRDEAHAWIKNHKQGVAEGLKLQEAEKGGRKVQLNKPFRTSDGKGKFAVYTKNEKGNVVKVNFGDTTGLTIKTSNPDRRRNFRARHNCDNPGPKHKARYWSCRAWSRGTVSAGLGT
jgi:hypothetical protein